MKYQNILGVDPGKKGGVCLLGPNFIKTFPFEGIIQTINVFKTLEATYSPLVILEDVHSMPDDGVVSVFSFGRNFGMYETVIEMACMPCVKVSPVVWQSVLGCLTGGNKNITKAKAKSIFPGLKITHATADAILLAVYGMMLYGLTAPPRPKA